MTNRTIQQKTCRTCEKRKPLTEFYKAAQARDGHDGHCKVCTRVVSKLRMRKKRAATRVPSAPGFPQLIECQCPICGGGYFRYRAALLKGRGLTCSRPCADAYRKAQYIERFWQRVERTNGCWRWTGGHSVDGYGTTTVYGRPARTHRVMYELTHGPIPDGLVVRHRCDNPGCVNPQHLELGTLQENSQDRERRGRSKRGVEHHKAKLTEEQVREIRETYRQGGITQRDMAARYGVSDYAIAAIVKGKTWAHLS